MLPTRTCGTWPLSINRWIVTTLQLRICAASFAFSITSAFGGSTTSVFAEADFTFFLVILVTLSLS